MNQALRYDEHGWCCSLLEPLAPELAFTVFSPRPSSRLELVALCRELERIAGARVRSSADKRYPHGATPTSDACELELAGGGLATTVLTWSTFPVARGAALVAAAREAAANMGGAGMDALLPRTQRLEQVALVPSAGGDERAPLLLAAALAQICLGPVLPPERDRLLGPSSLRSLVARVVRPE